MVPWATFLLVFLGSACDDAGIEEHDVPKGVEWVPEGPAETPTRPSEPVEMAESSRWVVPDGWTPDLEPRTMRVATYVVADALGDVEVAITRFSGRVGGKLANINRWRGQMGLPPVDDAQLEQSLTRFEAPGYEGYQTRIESDTGVMLASGVYDQAADHTWFVRATVSNADTADRLEADLFGFARSMAGMPEEQGG